MKGKRIACLLTVAVLLIGLLSGCGSAGSSVGQSFMGDSYSTSAQSKGASNAVAGWSAESYDREYASDEMYEEAPAAKPSGVTTGSDDTFNEWIPENLKVIYTGSISLESTEYDTAVSDLKKIVSDNKGWFESTYTDTTGSYRRVNYTVRVPAENFYVFCDQVGTVCQVSSLEQSAEDISEMYYDTEARLATQQTKLERLQKLLEEADTMETIIQLESSISQTEYDIERLTGSLRKYDSLVSYSTVYISLREVYQVTPVEEPVHTFGERFAQAVKHGSEKFVRGAQNLLLAIADSWTGWLIFVIIVVAVVLIIRRGVKAGRKKRKTAAVRPVETPPVSPAEQSEDDGGEK